MTPETRTRSTDGDVTVEMVSQSIEDRSDDDLEKLSVFPYGLSVESLKSVIHSLQIPVHVAATLSDADIVLTIPSKIKAKAKLTALLEGRQLPLHVLKEATNEALNAFFTQYYHLSRWSEDIEVEAEREADRACKKVVSESRVVELAPRESTIRKSQHRIVFEYGLNSVSVGEDPNRRVRILPRVS